MSERRGGGDSGPDPEREFEGLGEEDLALIARLRDVPVPDPGENYRRALAHRIEGRLARPLPRPLANPTAQAAPSGHGRGSIAVALALAALFAFALVLSPRARLDRPAAGDSGPQEEPGLIAGLAGLSAGGGRSPWDLSDLPITQEVPDSPWDLPDLPITQEVLDSPWDLPDLPNTQEVPDRPPEDPDWIPFDDAWRNADAELETLNGAEGERLVAALESVLRAGGRAVPAVPREPLG